ncbi:LysR family transcriptional regulator [Pusillimonas minor]|uniref:LysR family transcriptional regulator n=1 Tax=Pusillimonas minor TaxID=2697024 RepID=A0A842HM67_9BURK|nr:LysR family transcriptional regulator [Pusillimonas minor]MBC2768371.1 LysR family transcriptional regulator [Pusillimonas minor]
MDRLMSMQAFAKSVEAGSFSAAAEALAMSPQLVGKHVQALELHLGVRLLNRTTRRQRLTEAGEAFYERVKIILAEVDAAEGVAAQSLGTPRGRLRINAPVSFGVHALSKHLPKFMSHHPEVTVHLSLTNRSVDLIDEGFDVVFRVGELSDSGLIARKLAPYRLRLCAAPDYIATHTPIVHPSDLARHECLGFSYTDLRRRWHFESPQGAINIEVSGRFMADSGEALLSAARAGMGVMLQPDELVRDDLVNGTLVELLPNYSVPTRPLQLLYAPDRRMTPKIRSFIDFAIEIFGETE